MEAMVRVRLLLTIPDAPPGEPHEAGDLVEMDRVTALHCILEKMAEPVGWEPSDEELMEQLARDMAAIEAELRRRAKAAGRG